MTQFNDSSTGYQGVLPDDRNEAKDDGLLNAYAHMYDVVKEDKYRVEAINDEIAARQSADDAISKRFDDINVINPLHVDADNHSENNGIAIGLNSTARNESVSFGIECVSDNQGIAIGAGSHAEDLDSVALHGVTGGSHSVAICGSTSGENAVSIGVGSSATSDSVCVGCTSEANLANSICIGNSSRIPTTGTDHTAICIGNDIVANVYGCNAILIGHGISGTGISIGTEANSDSRASIAIGDKSQVFNNYSIAFGQEANVSAYGAVAIGYKSENTVENTVSIGSETLKRRIINVDTPVEKNDAVNKYYIDELLPSDFISFLKTIPQIQFGTTDSFNLKAGANIAMGFAIDGFVSVPHVYTNVYCNAYGAELVCVVKYVDEENITIMVSNIGNVDRDNITIDWLAIAGR